MSPSGSRMQTAGTSMVAIRFCRRASRSSASGRKTEGDDGFLWSSSGGIVFSERSAFEHGSVMIGRQFDALCEPKFACFDRLGRLLWRHPQFCLWASRLAKDRRFLTWSLMPVDDRKTPTRLQCPPHSSRQTRPIGDTMKGIRHEYEVNGPSCKSIDVIGITLQEVAIHCPSRRQPMSRKLQKVAVDVDRVNVACNLRHRQGEPAISATQVDSFSVAPESDCLNHSSRVGPQRIPPSSGGHFSAFKKTGETT